MKIALVTTTINVPRVLALYAKHDPNVMIFVAGDRKTDDIAVTDFLAEHCPNHAYYGIDWQHKLYPRLSALLGENCIQRRNIATLEAVKWGADVIVMIDDDNIPLDGRYFATSAGETFHGLCASSLSGWFDVGQLLSPKAEHRGFPHTKRAVPSFEAVTDAKIGVAAGICMGDPDIGAVERIANGPAVHNVSELLRSGVVTDPRKTWTVFNSQNTAFIRDLAPAMFMLPGCGRYDDIYASLICQRVMREQDLHVHFGRPFVYQQRNQHDLIRDLEQEISGMRNIELIAARLDASVIAPDSKPNYVLRAVRSLWRNVSWSKAISPASIAAALAWCDEIEKVL